jgi:hypothetical protein
MTSFIKQEFKIILNKNFQHLRNFGDTGTGWNLAKNREIVVVKI